MGWRSLPGLWCIGGLLALLVGSGCGETEMEDPAGMETRTATPAEQSVGLAGRWEGTTSQGMTIAFVVEDSGVLQSVSLIEYGVKVAACSWENSLSFAEPAPILASHLAVRLQTEAGMTDIDINFLSNDEADGKLSFSTQKNGAEPCSGNGEATFNVIRTR